MISYLIEIQSTISMEKYSLFLNDAGYYILEIMQHDNGFNERFTETWDEDLETQRLDEAMDKMFAIIKGFILHYQD